MSLKKWNEKPIPPNTKPEPSQSKKLTWDESGIRDENGIGIPIIYKPFIEAPKPDMVNHPPHYTRGKVETIDGLESAVEGLQGKEAGLTWQVIRYMWRWKFKNNPLEDLKKAEFYLKRLIKHVEGEPNE